MIPADFSETGFHATRPTKVRITRFQVVGERSSGTNFVKRLLGKNSDLRPTEDLGWKHGFPHAIAIPRDLAVICTVRRADAWALSMHTKPWHAVPALQKMEFSDFIRAPWNTVVDRPAYFADTQAADLVGHALQYDRNPITGHRFPNLFAMRRAKLYGHLSYLRRGCTTVLLCMETAQAEPEATLDAILTALRQPPRTEPFAGVHKRLGSRFRPSVAQRPETPKTISTEDMRFLRGNIDLKLEAALGYHYD